ncbi:MAG: (R)-1-hydroxy-2-aminoethylphosphonate ammonia-lyase [Candidatus Merdivicinus sp.]|jgi:4-aminobutyrate aminotransferase
MNPLINHNLPIVPKEDEDSMTSEQQKLTREGDINFSSQREKWYEALPSNTKEQLRADADIFMKQSMSTPCLDVLADAEGAYITDCQGKRYLDFHGNSLHQIGYKNPLVIEAIQKQLWNLPFVPRRFTADIVIKAANLLVEKTTSKDYRVLFHPSGSGAIGMALKIARKATGKQKIISMWESFHGAGLDAISVGGEAVFKKDMGLLMPGCMKAIPYNSYRNLLHSANPEKVADFCIEYIRYIIENEGDIGAILLEPVRATDIHIPPVSYFKKLRQICDENGILLIFDEIPTALGRSGQFYVHQNFEVEPDILVLGKGLGGGVIPQAAVLAKKQYDCAAEISLGHYTHEKPALGCAAICATIEYIDKEDLVERARELGTFMREQGEALYQKFECIGEIRQIGLMMAFEIVRDRETKEKDTQLAEKLLYGCLTEGLSFKVSGGSCLVWHPPLIVTKEQLKTAFAILKKVLEEQK